MGGNGSPKCLGMPRELPKIRLISIASLPFQIENQCKHRIVIAHRPRWSVLIITASASYVRQPKVWNVGGSQQNEMQLLNDEIEVKG